MSFLSLTEAFNNNTSTNFGQEKKCDILCMIVGLGTLSMSLGVIISVLAFIYMLSKGKLDFSLNEQDEVEIELGIKNAEKEPSSYFCKVGNNPSNSNTCDATSDVGYMRLLENEERYWEG